MSLHPLGTQIKQGGGGLPCPLIPWGPRCRPTDTLPNGNKSRCDHETVKKKGADGGSLSQGVGDLRKSLINFAKSTPWYNEATPASYVELKDRISALQEGGGVTWLAWPMYEQLCEACGVRDNHVEIATRFLHDLGILCYFRSVKKARSATREKLQSDVMLNSVLISPTLQPTPKTLQFIYISVYIYII